MLAAPPVGRSPRGRWRYIFLHPGAQRLFDNDVDDASDGRPCRPSSEGDCPLILAAQWTALLIFIILFLSRSMHPFLSEGGTPFPYTFLSPAHRRAACPRGRRCHPGVQKASRAQPAGVISAPRPYASAQRRVDRTGSGGTASFNIAVPLTRSAARGATRAGAGSTSVNAENLGELREGEWRPPLIEAAIGRVGVPEESP